MNIIKFVNNKGKVKMILPDDLTIEQLTVMGIQISLVPKEQPWKHGEVRNKEDSK